MRAPRDSAIADLERSDLLRALTLEAMLTRLHVATDGQSVLLVSDRPAVYAERLVARGASVVTLAPAALSAPAPTLPGENGPFGIVSWLDAGADPIAGPEFERSLVALARVLASGGWLALALPTAHAAWTEAVDPAHDGWGPWATTLWSCGLTVHDVRVTQRFGGPGVRVPAWLRPFPGLAYRLDRGIVMSGLRLGGNGARLVMARRPA
jgi:hypothetical protein